MVLFCRKNKIKKENIALKKELKELKEQLEEQKKEAKSERHLLKISLLNANCEIEELSKERDSYKSKSEKSERIIQKIQYARRVTAAKVGGLSNKIKMLEKEYESKLNKARDIIKDLDKEVQNLKRRPTLEELKLEKVSVSSDVKKKIKK